jgi:hypothetical protein
VACVIFRHDREYMTLYNWPQWKPRMKRPTDTFSFQLELGKRLKDLRLRAGLTRAELVQAMGRAGSELVKSLPPDRRPGR